MSCELVTIRTAYEDEAMSPEQIAESQDLDLAAVKAALMQCSPQYRKDCGREEETEDILNFSNDDLTRVNQVIVDIALGGEDEGIRLKAATYIRDDKKGRKEVVKAIGQNNFNILFINEQLKKVRGVADNIKGAVRNGSSHQKAINV